MTELERYIRSNAGAFDMEPVPERSRERFMAAVASQRRKRRIRTAYVTLTGIAAVFAALMVLFMNPDISWELERHHNRLADKENEIMIMVERNHPYETEEVRNMIRSITAETIPLEDQLPEELPIKEKSRILNNYYNQKHSALESLMAEYR